MNQTPLIPQKPGIDLKNESTPMEFIDVSKLEYPLVPITQISKQFATDQHYQIPPYLKELPKDKVLEMAEKEDLQRGYVLNKYGDEYLTARNLITEDLEQQQKYSATQINDKERLNRIDNINQQLDKYQLQLDRFNKLQVSMYDKMNKLSKGKIISQMESDLEHQNAKCQHLVTKCFNIQSTLKDDELNDFITNYQHERSLYYLKREKLSRMREDRVSEN